MEVGKIYRVNAYAVSEDCEYRVVNTRYVNQHGYLWLCVEEQDDLDGLFLCRSVATGNVLGWVDEEVEEAG